MSENDSTHRMGSVHCFGYMSHRRCFGVYLHFLLQILNCHYTERCFMVFVFDIDRGWDRSGNLSNTK